MIQLDMRITQIEGFNENHLWMMLKIVDIMKKYRKTKFKISTLEKWTGWGRSKVFMVGKGLREMKLIKVDNTTKKYGGQGANEYRITTGFISYLVNLENETFEIEDNENKRCPKINTPQGVEGIDVSLPQDVVLNGVRKSTTAVSENQPPISKPIYLPNSLKEHAGEKNFSKKISEKISKLTQLLELDPNSDLTRSITRSILRKNPKRLEPYLDYLLINALKSKYKYQEVYYTKWAWERFLQGLEEKNLRETSLKKSNEQYQRRKQEVIEYLDEVEKKAVKDPEKIKKGIDAMRKAREEARKKNLVKQRLDGSRGKDKINGGSTNFNSGGFFEGVVSNSSIEDKKTSQDLNGGVVQNFAGGPVVDHSDVNSVSVNQYADLNFELEDVDVGSKLFNVANQKLNYDSS